MTATITALKAAWPSAPRNLDYAEDNGGIVTIPSDWIRFQPTPPACARTWCARRRRWNRFPRVSSWSWCSRRAGRTPAPSGRARASR